MYSLLRRHSYVRLRATSEKKGCWRSYFWRATDFCHSSRSHVAIPTVASPCVEKTCSSTGQLNKIQRFVIKLLPLAQYFLARFVFANIFRCTKMNQYNFFFFLWLAENIYIYNAELCWSHTEATGHRHFAKDWFSSSLCCWLVIMVRSAPWLLDMGADLSSCAPPLQITSSSGISNNAKRRHGRVRNRPTT